MIRAEAYAEGFHEGRRRAEADMRNHSRADVRYGWASAQIDSNRARQIGTTRGYRDTWARYDAGTLTPEMFELAPRGGTR